MFKKYRLLGWNGIIIYRHFDLKKKHTAPKYFAMKQVSVAEIPLHHGPSRYVYNYNSHLQSLAKHEQSAAGYKTNQFRTDNLQCLKSFKIMCNIMFPFFVIYLMLDELCNFYRYFTVYSFWSTAYSYIVPLFHKHGHLGKRIISYTYSCSWNILEQ